MIRIFNKWIFINYCGQKIGQINTSNIQSSLLNVLVSQIAPLSFIPLFFIYILVGLRSFGLLLVLIIIQAIIVRYGVKSLTRELIDIKDLEHKYRNTKRKERVINFVSAIVMTILCILGFGYSLFFLEYFK